MRLPPRILDFGTLFHAELGDVPAVRTLNAIYGQEWVWAFTGRRGKKPPSFVEHHIPDRSYRAHLLSQQEQK